MKASTAAHRCKYLLFERRKRGILRSQAWQIASTLSSSESLLLSDLIDSPSPLSLTIVGNCKPCFPQLVRSAPSLLTQASHPGVSASPPQARGVSRPPQRASTLQAVDTSTHRHQQAAARHRSPSPAAVVQGISPDPVLPRCLQKSSENLRSLFGKSRVSFLRGLFARDSRTAPRAFPLEDADDPTKSTLQTYHRSPQIQTWTPKSCIPTYAEDPTQTSKARPIPPPEKSAAPRKIR